MNLLRLMLLSFFFGLEYVYPVSGNLIMKLSIVLSDSSMRKLSQSRGGRVIANGFLRKEARREHLDYKQGAAE
jgi:hypothetical protein